MRLCITAHFICVAVALGFTITSGVLVKDLNCVCCWTSIFLAVGSLIIGIWPLKLAIEGIAEPFIGVVQLIIGLAAFALAIVCATKTGDSSTEACVIIASSFALLSSMFSFRTF